MHVIRHPRPTAAVACIRLILAAVCLSLVSAASLASQQLNLPKPRDIAPGVQLYHLDQESLVDSEGPISIWALRLDPIRVDLQSVLANDEIVGTETVPGIAERHRPLAAINAGYFQANGDPSGVMTIDGRLVSDTRRPRGAVGISTGPGGVTLAFARLRATAALVVQRTGAAPATIPINGVDTTRLRGQLMLFTPSYHADTDTAKGGLEWVVDGRQGRIVSGPHRTGATRIPPAGFVLSFGGATVPASLQVLRRGARVRLEVTYDPVEGDAATWSAAQDIVGGAGLLIRDGRDVDDWSVETFTQSFAELRHPRTLIGTSADKAIWLVAVDGRQPEHSVGMTLAELRGFAHKLGLVNALNLDGGGSTTMWVQGQVLNHPSDIAGARKVSDALLVYAR